MRNHSHEDHVADRVFFHSWHQFNLVHTAGADQQSHGKDWTKSVCKKAGEKFLAWNLFIYVDKSNSSGMHVSTTSKLLDESQLGSQAAHRSSALVMKSLKKTKIILLLTVH